MSKRNGTKNKSVVIEAPALEKVFAKEDSTISITGAEIKDDFCHYSYEIISGKPAGFTHNVKGTGIIDDDMRTAFSKLNVHLAVIDDVFKHSDITIGDIDKMHNDDLALLYMSVVLK
jgi:hypothetical protein